MKQKDLLVGTTVYTVNMGVNYFYKYFIEATGIDLISQGLIDVKSVKVFDYVAGFIYAGHKAHCSVTGSECGLTFQAAEHQVMSMSETDAMNLFMECAALMSGTNVDDLKNATTQAAPRNGSARVKANR